MGVKFLFPLPCLWCSRLCQLLPCDCCKALCMAAEAEEGLIQGTVSREEVVVVVMVTWIICSFWISLMRVLRRSSDDWVPFCWANRLFFSSKHCCQTKRRGERREDWEYIQIGVKHLPKHPFVSRVHILLEVYSPLGIAKAWLNEWSKNSVTSTAAAKVTTLFHVQMHAESISDLVPYAEMPSALQTGCQPGTVIAVLLESHKATSEVSQSRPMSLTKIWGINLTMMHFVPATDFMELVLWK